MIGEHISKYNHFERKKWIMTNKFETIQCHIMINMGQTVSMNFIVDSLFSMEVRERKIQTFKEQNDMHRLSSLPEKTNSFRAPAIMLG